MGLTLNPQPGKKLQPALDEGKGPVNELVPNSTVCRSPLLAQSDSVLGTWVDSAMIELCENGGYG